MSKLIKHENGNHSFYLKEEVVQELGHKLVLVNPERIKRIFDTMVKHYPVQSDSLPTLDKLINIDSETLPNHYAVCSQESFDLFIKELNDIDLITKNDFLVNNKINSYHFTL